MKNYINTFNNIKSKWNNFNSKENNKKIRIRDVAKKLNVSEAELLSTKVNDDVSYLKIKNYNLFFKDILNSDKLMFLIRTDNIVHELIVDSSYIDIKKNSFFDLKQNFPILEFNSKSFSYTFFEKKNHSGKELRSFQIFNKSGHSVLKIYLKGKSTYIFDRIAKKYTIEYDYIIQKNKHKFFVDSNKIEIFSFFKTDYNLDAKFALDKQINLGNNTLRYILEKSSAKKVPIQIHAFGNTIIQYYRGKVNNVIDFGPWINIIDKGFNIHIFESKITNAFLNKYTDNNNTLFVINFFDIDNNHVLGISPIRDYEKELNKIIDSLI